MKSSISISRKIKPYNKEIQIDGDKSLSIRWALLASQAMGKSNCKIVAKGTPSMLINDTKAKTAYFGNSFKIN